MLDAPKVKTDRRRKPELTEAAILTWADAHHRRTGTWPTKESGPVPDGPLGTTWRQVDNTQCFGLRGLPGGSSLARLLAEHRGVRNQGALPPLTEGQILGWAEVHRRRTGKLPTAGSGPIAEAPWETWKWVDSALREGRRGLRRGSTRPSLLDRLR